MRLQSWCLAAWAICAITFELRAEDWPQWRGPHRDGISKETGLLKVWPAEGPKLLWQAKDLGEGYSTPSVVGNRIYVIKPGARHKAVCAVSRRRPRRYKRKDWRILMAL